MSHESKKSGSIPAPVQAQNNSDGGKSATPDLMRRKVRTWGENRAPDATPGERAGLPLDSARGTDQIQQAPAPVPNGLPPFYPGIDLQFSRHTYIAQLHRTIGNQNVTFFFPKKRK